MKQTIQHWFSKLPFPSQWREEFVQLLDQYDLMPCVIDAYEFGVDSQRDLLMCLYFCQELQLQYQTRGISHTILMHTLSDMVTYIKIYHQLYGRLGIAESWWIKKHLQMKLFWLGRLQFAIGNGEIEIHIPEGEPLLPEACNQSFQMAKSFFAEHFPQVAATRFTCDS